MEPITVLWANIRAEWVKLRSVRSTLWALAITIAITVALSALFASTRVSRWDRMSLAEQVRFEPIGFSLNGIFLSQLAIGVLGVLVMTSEFATGQIRATFAATPSRGTVLLAKIGVFAVVGLVIGEIASFTAFFVGQAILSSKHSASISDPGALRSVLGGGLYLAGIGVFGLGLGVILRRTAGAIAVLVASVMILPQLVELLPSPWNDDISKYLPSPAGQAMFHIESNRPSLSAGVGLLVFLAYAVGACLIGWLLLRTRDA
jgi:hypothetical protein